MHFDFQILLIWSVRLCTFRLNISIRVLRYEYCKFLDLTIGVTKLLHRRYSMEDMKMSCLRKNFLVSISCSLREVFQLLFEEQPRLLNIHHPMCYEYIKLVISYARLNSQILEKDRPFVGESEILEIWSFKKSSTKVVVEQK